MPAAMTPTPVDLFHDAIRFAPDGSVSAARRQMADGEHLQLAAFHVATDADVHADHWEMHPTADEVVCCLRGRFRIHLRAESPHEQDACVTLGDGEAHVVERGRWHRLTLDRPSDVMTVTRRAGTQLERATTDDRGITSHDGRLAPPGDRSKETP